MSYNVIVDTSPIDINVECFSSNNVTIDISQTDVSINTPNCPDVTVNFPCNNITVNTNPFPVYNNTNTTVITGGNTGSYIFNTPIQSGVLQQFILFPAILDADAMVIATLNTTSDSNIYCYQPSGISSSGYWANFSAAIDSNGYSIDTLATISTNSGLATTIINDINTGQFLYTGYTQEFATPIFSGFNSQQIIFPYNFSVIPRVLITIEVTGTNMYFGNIKNRTISGFLALFTAIIRESGVILHTYASVQ